MAISSETRRAGPFQGNGTQTMFEFEFKIFDPSEVRVMVSTDNGETESELDADLYDTELNADQDGMPGGTVTLKEALAEGSILSILSDVPYLQPMVLTNRGGFYPDMLNDSSDRAVILAQQNREILERTLKVPSTSEKTPEQLTEELLEAQTEAKQFATEAAASAEEALQAAADAQTVVGLTPEIKAVAENIHHVVTDSQNIDAIKAAAEAKNAIQTVASDFTGEVPTPNIHDFGVWGVDSIPSTRPTGGTISTVAEGIEDVQTTAENIEVVKTLVEELPKAEEILEQIKGNASAAKASETAAASSATTAAQSAAASVTAQEAAEAAQSAAEEAMGAAQSAQGYAESAADAAGDAASATHQYATNAQTSASAAAQSASAAQQSAEYAAEIAGSLGDPLGKAEAAKTYATKTELTQGLGTKAPSSHTHTSDQITDLDQKFSEKLSPYATTETVNSGLSGKADSDHTHTMSQISDLSFDFGKWEAA